MKTILVLGQHPDLAEAIRAALNAEQYRIIHRANIEEAEPFLQPGGLDLSIIDVELSNVQGLWSIEKIRRGLPACPVLVFTGPEPWEWEEEAYVHGVLHVLSKPVRPRMFAALVDRLWASASLVPARPRPLAALRRAPPPEPKVVDAGRTHIRALEVLRDFSAVLTHSLCAEAMLKQFLLLLREILGVNRAAIFLRPPLSGFGVSPDENRRFRSACAIGLSSGLLEHFELSFEAGLGGFLYRQGRIVRRDSEEVLDDVEMQKEFELLGVQVAIPILDRETLIGVATFDGRVTGEPLANTELELIFHLLEQLGLAVRNIWLHDQLGANNEMMADILRQLSSACVVVSRDLTILHCNKTARQYFGKAGRRNAELEFSDLPQVLGSKVYQVLKTGTAIATFKYQPGDSPQAIYHITIVPFQRQDSLLPNSALLVVEDHTQAQQLQRLEIETANLRLVKTMADRLAHEIGNAMVPLSTHQQLLAEQYRDPEFRDSLGVALTDGVKRVSRLINQMRFLARDAVEPRDAFPLAPLIEEAYQEAQKHQPVKSAKLLFEPGNQPTFLTGDRAALKHAFAEVLLNALQANPADPQITVRVHVDSSGTSRTMSANGSNGISNGHGSPNNGRALEIEIQDNGTGFSPEALEKVPQPFFTTRNVGLGLGMTVSRKIIETHHGQITFLSPKDGQSGIVRISLPTGAQNEKMTGANAEH